MTPAEQRRRMSDRIIDEALEAVRLRAEDDEVNSRIHRLCDDAADARRVCRARALAWPRMLRPGRA